MRIDSILLLFALALSLLGCDPLNVLGIGKQSAPEDFSGQYIQTSKDAYEWDGEELIIEYTYDNPFDRTVYMAGCADGAGSSEILEKRVDGDWEVVYSRICLLRFGKPTEIGPGESYEASFKLADFMVEQGRWRADSVPGTYRFREPMYWRWDEKEALADELETGTWRSNGFEIR